MTKLPELINPMFAAAQKRGSKRRVDRVVNLLTRITTTCMNDVFVLCGNGSGTGALRIVRGMFESSTVAEYLCTHPKEAEDYEDFGRVIAWRRCQWMLKNTPGNPTLSPQTIKRIQDEYDSVRGRFTNAKGRVRPQWTTLSISEMTKAIGREDQYELVYSWLSSMHHVNAEGMMAHVEAIESRDGTDFLKLGSPSLHLVNEALVAAHTYVVWALQTFNDCCGLGFDDKLGEAAEDFRNVSRHEILDEHSLSGSTPSSCKQDRHSSCGGHRPSSCRLGRRSSCSGHHPSSCKLRTRSSCSDCRPSSCTLGRRSSCNGHPHSCSQPSKPHSSVSAFAIISSASLTPIFLSRISECSSTSTRSSIRVTPMLALFG